MILFAGLSLLVGLCLLASPLYAEDLDQLDKTKMYLIHCKSGGRSAGAFNTMKELEFMEVYNMPGGINQWISEAVISTCNSKCCRISGSANYVAPDYYV